LRWTKSKKLNKSLPPLAQNDIFSLNPFIVRPDGDSYKVKINHINVIRQFILGRKTFGESFKLKKLILEKLTEEEFENLKSSANEVVVTVANLSLNQVEYKSIKDYNYREFCEWIWTSCNFVPFMSLNEKNGYEYADGGFGSKVPIEEAIHLGAKTIDVIILDSEMAGTNLLPSKNVFSLLTHLNLYMAERISRQNIRIGKLIARSKDVTLNFYYTPTSVTAHSSSLIFNAEKMKIWWDMGYHYAQTRNESSNEIRNSQKE
jgi:NTE family protein